MNRPATSAPAPDGIMQTVQLNRAGLTLPYILLLPMALIAYNNHNRQLTITSATPTLPQPIVNWLQQSAQHRGLISAIMPATSATPTAPSTTGSSLRADELSTTGSSLRADELSTTGSSLRADELSTTGSSLRADELSTTGSSLRADEPSNEE